MQIYSHRFKRPVFSWRHSSSNDKAGSRTQPPLTSAILQAGGLKRRSLLFPHHVFMNAASVPAAIARVAEILHSSEGSVLWRTNITWQLKESGGLYTVRERPGRPTMRDPCIVATKAQNRSVCCQDRSYTLQWVSIYADAPFLAASIPNSNCYAFPNSFINGACISAQQSVRLHQ